MDEVDATEVDDELVPVVDSRWTRGSSQTPWVASQRERLRAM